MTAPLRRVLVRAPAETDCARWREYGWRSEPDPARLSAEHEDFCAILAEHGAEVVHARTPLEDGLDAIYAHDSALVCDAGAIALRPGKAIRPGEQAAAAADLEAAGVPVIASLAAPATAEARDLPRLAERTPPAVRRHPT